MVCAFFNVNQFKKRFKWLRASHFVDELATDLRSDAEALLDLLDCCGRWDPANHAKLAALHKLLTKTHAGEKVLVFTQFADTVRYLSEQLQALGVDRLAGVTGGIDNPTQFAWRFSPKSNLHESNRNDPAFRSENELRVLIATDVLSEGQNLQDASVIVNYDLPWAIIRLIQRAGRVDRIGQRADRLCIIHEEEQSHEPQSSARLASRLPDHARTRPSARPNHSEPDFSLRHTDKKPILICMRTTLNIDDALLAEAMASTGVQEKTAVIKMGLQALIERNAARRLSALGGTMPRLDVPPRRRQPTRPSHGAR